QLERRFALQGMRAVLLDERFQLAASLVILRQTPAHIRFGGGEIESRLSPFQKQRRFRGGGCRRQHFFEVFQSEITVMLRAQPADKLGVRRLLGPKRGGRPEENERPANEGGTLHRSRLP